MYKEFVVTGCFQLIKM